ncbi:mucin-like protein [Actinia tenebrosa]|uniref:Mucin-like protein n=1 Tax=Actinia tenebrosa TaxID=6105 RepID=A0A6P8HHF1_ACTTE|nr:mucin-like protein [Actinia tenebrosa]
MRWEFNCTDPSQLCVNTAGSYKCDCEAGLYWIDNKCRALKKDEPTPTPPPAPTPKTPTDNELENAVIIKLENLTFIQWNKENEDRFKEAVAKAVTEYCAIASHDCGARDPNRVIIYTADQVHLVPDFLKENPNHLAFYVNQPPGVGQPGKSTIEKDTLIKIIESHQDDIGKSLNTRVTDVRPYKEPAPGPKETDYLPIIIGSAVGLVVLLLLILFAVWLLYRSRSKVAATDKGEPLTEKEIKRIKHFPFEELEMQTEIPRANAENRLSIT